MGELVGPSALGAGRIAIMTATLRDGENVVPSDFGEAITVVGKASLSSYYWLDLSYVDVFDNLLGACAFFDPEGLGVWRHRYGPRIGPTP